jgi:3-deoxy-D-manno-octulosonate 8-phosphate phosphatase (KDO 8-P phosphatase)
LASKKPSSLQTKIARIQMVILDVDGVLTDGKMIYVSNGSEYKEFNVYDGYGMTRAMEKGLMLAMMSRGESKAVDVRAKIIGLEDVVQGAKDKLSAYHTLREKHELRNEDICYMGDDIYDIPVLKVAGLSAAPCTAFPDVLKHVDIVTKAAAGRGAVRELLDTILRKKNLLDLA